MRKQRQLRLAFFETGIQTGLNIEKDEYRAL